MDTVLEQFDSVLRDKGGETYRVFLYGRSRPHDTWQGWLVFVRERDGRSFDTSVETTQPNREAMRYWATGLTDTYLDGALGRALVPPPAPAVDTIMPPMIQHGVDSIDREERRREIERDILAVFSAAKAKKLLAQEVFEAIPHANADIDRALEHLVKRDQLLIRRTEEGNDWLVLTPAGIRAAMLPGAGEDVELRHRF